MNGIIVNPSIVVFSEQGFPTIGSLLPDEAFQGVAEVVVVGADELAETLKHMDNGCFVNLHAPYFPKSAWTEIVAFLHRGGGLLNVGGAPFKHPVRNPADEHGDWIIETEQTAYHQELHIHEVLRVDASKVASLVASEDIPVLCGQESLFQVADTWNLVPHTTKSSDLPHQMGSAGPMNTQIYPLLKGVSKDGRDIAAPGVLWEHARGLFAGARWMFIHVPLRASFWEQDGEQLLAQWARFCAKGMTELSIKPNYAAYESGERAILTLQTQRLQREGATPRNHEIWSFDLTVEQILDEYNQQVWSNRLQIEVSKEQNFVRIPLGFSILSGLYGVICRAESSDGEVRILRQGFWGQDAELLAEGHVIMRSRDYFIKDGRPLPVVGMTYMTSDVARKFLFLPNAAIWDRDMAQMAKAGINWIRTGVWTAYRNMMQIDGHASEEVLRAIDAFLLTAKRHGLQVTFTFFSFTPETWEGVNPYLDPQSVEAQKRFIRSIVSRHTATTHVDWDLINEPSMFDPSRIFADGPRSARDSWEQAAFSTWLEQRHGSIEALQEAWNMTPQQLSCFASATIPEPEEINFGVQDMHQAKKGAKWLDYCLFSMEMHNLWAEQLATTIRELCPGHLVTVGQDEALGAQRPSPFFYEAVVDYTTVHSWWLNDHLVWDGIFAKTPDKPNLVQETGIMYVETPDGRAKRSEEELRDMLERKYAYAFSTGGAGAIHWIWNTNFYMDNANESHIGALRADGTEKPEAEVSYDFGRFMNEIRDLFTDRKLEETAVVFPYSNDFSNRSLAFDTTTRLTRVMSYNLKQPFRAVSEYHLDSLKRQLPKLIMVPSAHNFDSTSLEHLLEIVRAFGVTLLVTGPLGLDPYWKMTDRVDDIIGQRILGNVQREEVLSLEGQTYSVSFGQRRIAEVAKEELLSPEADGAMGDEVVNLPLGRGRLIWSPLPLELNGRDKPIAELYRYAFAAAGVERELEWIDGGDQPGLYGRKLNFKNGGLYIFVSEFSRDTQVRVRDKETGLSYAFLLPRSRSILFAVGREGQLLAVYRPEDVTIEVIQ
ncbi:glycoside hydrolase [Paenibacillus polymyxa]|uniref:beta-galactosidase n=1 Tax=Paenibacillus polymyxa TaxID=1406 RepID=UPI000D3043D9|nr:beta-galactosidase [Paenibacillus polymyxa]PTU47901.1 glycoside hydrolase [Paenibacillus polymyxa]